MTLIPTFAHWHWNLCKNYSLPPESSKILLLSDKQYFLKKDKKKEKWGVLNVTKCMWILHFIHLFTQNLSQSMSYTYQMSVFRLFSLRNCLCLFWCATCIKNAAHNFAWDREDNCWVLLLGNVIESLEVTQLQCGFRLRDDIRGFF